MKSDNNTRFYSHTVILGASTNIPQLLLVNPAYNPVDFINALRDVSLSLKFFYLGFLKDLSLKK